MFQVQIEACLISFSINILLTKSKVPFELSILLTKSKVPFELSIGLRNTDSYSLPNQLQVLTIAPKKTETTNVYHPVATNRCSGLFF